MKRWLLVPLLWALCLAAAGQTRLELRAAVVQPGSVLALGDVIDGGQHRDVWAALALPPKGRVGDTVVYSRAEITEQLWRAFPQLAPLHWSGAERVLVQRRGRSLAPQDYTEWARRYLAQQLARSAGRHELALAGDYRALRIPLGECAAQARLEREPRAGETRVWLDIAVDGHAYTSIPVSFNVRWWRPALVLKQAGAAHLTLDVQQVETREADVSRVNGEPLQDGAQLAGMRLRHALEAGAVLGSGDIETRPPVAQGQTIDVYASVGRVVVQTRAVAQRDGFLGQRIGALVAGNNESLMVEVTGENRAVVSNNR